MGLELGTSIAGASMSPFLLFEPETSQRLAAIETELKHLSFLNHDLNNNLNSVTLHLSLLRDRLMHRQGFPEELAMLDAAQRTIDLTMEGMSRLLTYARLRTGRQPPLRIQSVDLHQLAKDIAAQFSAQANAGGVDICSHVMERALVETDPALLSLVLQNLVCNSVKFSNRGGNVRIDAQAFNTVDRANWIISVEDEGPGIPPELLPNIFAGVRHGQAAGLGLGLLIASSAAKLLGADLSVDSQLGVGTTFHLTLNKPA